MQEEVIKCKSIVVDIGESISNKAVQYTVFIMFSDGTRDTFSINDIDSIRDLKERINAEYSVILLQMTSISIHMVPKNHIK